MDRVDARALYGKISRRLIPYIFLLYILAYLDRVNVGFAAIEMKRDLRLSNTVYGIGAGIFFLGQGLFDLPSNLLLGKVGPRLWIARIMLSWGVVATCMSLVTGPHSFYGLRFLLGVSEAGFFPGMILYLTYWFPSQERARAIAKFMTAVSLAGVIGAPVSSGLLRLEGFAHLHGWQWLFLVEGAATILGGVSVFFFLRDHPKDASWLSPIEKDWLAEELERDRQEGGAADRHNLKDAFKLPMVWLLAAIFMLEQIGLYTVNLWMPIVLNGIVRPALAATRVLQEPGSAEGGGSAGHIVALSILPYLASTILMVAIGWSSDRAGERRLHMSACMTAAAAGLAWAGFAHSLASGLGAFTLAAVGLLGLMGPFWALPTRVLGGRAAQGGVAIVTVAGSIGGLTGPSLTGHMRDATHSFTPGLLAVAGSSLLAALLCLLLPAKASAKG